MNVRDIDIIILRCGPGRTRVSASRNSEKLYRQCGITAEKAGDKFVSRDLDLLEANSSTRKDHSYYY